MTALSSELLSSPSPPPKSAHPAEVFDDDVRLVWEAGLAVRTDHPFFFDHPLDHVPAILLVESALRLIGHASELRRPPRAGLLHLEFHRFCEFEEAAVVRAWETPSAPGFPLPSTGGAPWRLEFVQGGTVIGEGSFAYGAYGERVAEDADGCNPPPSAAVPVPAGLVHRARPENVLIGGFERLGEDAYAAELLDPAPEHHLVDGAAATRSLAELIEGIRQFATLLGHEAREVALDGQFIVRSVHIRLDRPIRRGRGVLIRCCGLPTARRRGAGAMRFSVGTPDGICGEASVAGHVVSRRAYEHLRRMRPGPGATR